MSRNTSWKCDRCFCTSTESGKPRGLSGGPGPPEDWKQMIDPRRSPALPGMLIDLCGDCHPVLDKAVQDSDKEARAVILRAFRLQTDKKAREAFRASL